MELETFGPYHLIGPVERTSVAEISHGLLLTSGGVAIPATVKRALDESSDRIDLLHKEAELGAMFEHERIVRILDFGHLEGRTYVATQRVLGRSLKAVTLQAIMSNESADPIASILIAVRVLEALEQIHARRFVHGDVRPENVLVGYDGSVRLGGCAHARMTDADLDQRTDLCDVGLCLRDLMPLWQTEPMLLHAATKVIERATASDRTQRHGTVAAFRDDLMRLLDPAEAMPSSIVEMMARLFPRDEEKERRTLERLAAKLISDTLVRERPRPSLESTISQVVAVREEPLVIDPAEAPLMEPTSRDFDWNDDDVPDVSEPVHARRLIAVSALVLLIPLIAYASSSDEHKETAGRYLRYAVLGQKPGGMLTIESVPAGAHLFLDGSDSGKKTPIIIASLESEIEHKLRLELPGEEPETSTVTIAAGEKRTVTVTIRSAMTSLRVASDPPRSEVEINGRAVALSPCTIPVRNGQPLTLRITKIGHVTYEETITPVRGVPLERTIALQKTAELLEAEKEEAEVRAALEDENAPVKKEAVKKKAKKKKHKRRGHVRKR